VEAADVGHDNGGEAVPRGNVQVELAHGPGDFPHPGQPGGEAGEEQAHPHRALGGEPGVAGGLGCQTAHIELVGEKAFAGEEPEDQGGGQGNENGHIDPHAVKEQGQGGRIPEHDGLGEIHALRVPPGALDQVGEEKGRHIGEHQGGEGLIRVEAGLEQGRNTTPQGASHGSGQEHEGQGQVLQGGVGGAVQKNGDAAATDGPGDQLAFRPDVVDAGPEADGQPLGDEDQGGGLDQQFAPAVGAG